MSTCAKHILHLLPIALLLSHSTHASLITSPPSRDTDWLHTHSVASFSAYFARIAHASPTDAYTQRIHDSHTQYHSQPFVHIPPAIDSIAKHNASLFTKSKNAMPWVGRAAPYIPEGNLELNTATLEAYRDRNIDPSDDRMRVIYIKSHKVASTTVSSILARMVVTRHTSDSRLRFAYPIEPRDIVLDHNWFNGRSRNVLRRDCSQPQWCGGYQPFGVRLSTLIFDC